MQSIANLLLIIIALRVGKQIFW